MKNSFSCYVILVLCVQAAVAQFLGGQSQPTFQTDLDRSRLSAQQQGHILSDIQQHQHRFNLHQNIQNAQFPNQNLLAQQLLVQQPFNNFVPNQQALSSAQASLNSHTPLLNRAEQPQTSLLPTPANPVIFPSASSDSNSKLVQHHTQTAFTPNFSHQLPINQLEQTHLQGQFETERQKLKLKELQEKQAIIEKHNQYVEKQYEKALKKAEADHIVFIQQQKEQKKNLYQRLSKPPGSPIVSYRLNNPRALFPDETPLFNIAVQKYYEEHPTTTTTTTTTTTKPPPTTSTTTSDPLADKQSEGLLQASPQSLYNQIKRLTSKSVDEKPRNGKILSFLPTAIPTQQQQVVAIQSLEDLQQLQSQYRNNQIGKDDLLAQLKLAIAGNSEDDLGKNITSREISLANGETIQIIRTTDPKLVEGATPLEHGSSLEQLLAQTTTTTARPHKQYLEELTKGVLPPGAKFEVLRHGENGGLEKISGLPQNLPNQKPVTFVLLEEQPDGSFKVQGVKGSDKKESNEDVDSILKRIKDGEIKLPTTSRGPVVSTSATPTKTTTYFTTNPTTKIYSTRSIIPSVEFTSNSVTPSSSIVPSSITPSVSVIPNSITPVVSIIPNSVATSGGKVTKSFKLSTNLGVSPPRQSSSTTRPILHSRSSPSSNNDLIRQASTASSVRLNSIFSENNGISSTYKPSPTTPTLTTPTASSTTAAHYTEQELPEILKKQGLYAMAKFLKQSGLDTILNETGPYTVFAPTDKAFRTLLVQLGGPEKAEEKFKENPRLLSGLLLHHIIPGGFTLSSLQDEMTGVSLAGTQLRVNQYKMHDLEWNDVRITTINGAKVADDKKDIEIPQGLAHAVDRVMFPLPVGDIVQTLQSDRERRFTNFLRALFASGLADSLQGSKTFTLFAPTDKAFTVLSTEDLQRLVSDKILARELVMRHLIPGTLYTTGMRYYQVRESQEPDRPITLSKNSGKVRVNNAQIVTQNIPATNGVIQAIDVLL